MEQLDITTAFSCNGNAVEVVAPTTRMLDPSGATSSAFDSKLSRI